MRVSGRWHRLPACGEKVKRGITGRDAGATGETDNDGECSSESGTGFQPVGVENESGPSL